MRNTENWSHPHLIIGVWCLEQLCKYQKKKKKKWKMLMCTLTECEAVTFEAHRRPQNLSLEGQHKRPETPEGCSRVGGCGESQLDRADQRSDDLLNVGLWKKITTTTSNRRSFFWLRLFLVFHTQTRLRTHTQKNTPSSSRSVILTTALQPAAKIAVWRCHNNIFFFSNTSLDFARTVSDWVLSFRNLRIPSRIDVFWQVLY